MTVKALCGISDKMVGKLQYYIYTVETEQLNTKQRFQKCKEILYFHAVTLSYCAVISKTCKTVQRYKDTKMYQICSKIYKFKVHLNI